MGNSPYINRCLCGHSHSEHYQCTKACEMEHTHKKDLYTDDHVIVDYREKRHLETFATGYRTNYITTRAAYDICSIPDQFTTKEVIERIPIYETTRRVKKTITIRGCGCEMCTCEQCCIERKNEILKEFDEACEIYLSLKNNKKYHELYAQAKYGDYSLCLCSWAYRNMPKYQAKQKFIMVISAIKNDIQEINYMV